MTRPVATRGWELHHELLRLQRLRPDAPPKALARMAGCTTETAQLHLTMRCACDPSRLTNRQSKP